MILAILVLGGTIAALRFLPDEGKTPIVEHPEETVPALAINALALPDRPSVAPVKLMADDKIITRPSLTVTNTQNTLVPPPKKVISETKPPEKIANSPLSLLEESKTAITVKLAPKSVENKALPQTPAPRAELKALWNTHKIASGESLSRIFKDQSLSASLLHKIVNSSKQAKQLAKIRPGQMLKFLFDDENQLEQLVLVKSPVESLHIRANDNGFTTELISKNIEKRTSTAAGTIQSSLFVDGVKAGLTDSQMIELAALFGWDIDFALEIRAGDQFRVLFEEQYLEGKKYRNGPILAAEFVNRGKVYQAVRFDDGNDNINYYDAQGRNKRRAFIRTPIKFARVSSRFNPRRMHPVLKKRRPHKGVDYAAPIGTPIKATGAGKVTFRGWKGGYGRVVIVQHGSKYQTLYAHMSKFSSKAKAGRKVKQGQIVGYVGKSGRVTGAHLHYEFRVNGVHRNPLTVKLPKSLPLPKKQLLAFKKQTAPLLTQLASIKPATMVASN